jgi:hypothetical protein
VAQIRLDFPTASAPTASVVLSPAFTVVQPYRRSAFQRVHTSEDGTVHTFTVAALVEEILEMTCTDINEADEISGDGAAKLLAFIANNLDYRRLPCDLTDADGVVTTVRLWSPEVEFVEAAGGVRVQGRFSGRLLWRKEL